MNKTMLSRALVAALALLLWSAHTPAARAHGGPPRVELGAEQIAPGAALEVRGINIAPDQQVTVSLVGQDLDLPLGVVVGDPHGDFTQVFALPSSVAPGAYTVRAFGANRVVVGVALTVVGTGTAGDAEEGDQREEEEPLLAPMPQPAGGQPQRAAVPAGQPQAGPQAPAGEVPAVEPSMRLAITLVVVVLAVVGVTVVVRRWARAAG